MRKQQRSRWLSSFFQRLAAIANHDFCPWANRYVYWLKQPIGWFAVAALAAGLTGAFVAPQAWVVCAIVLVVMVLGTAWPWLAMRGLAAEISFDRRRCHELDAVTVFLTVTNRGPWPVWGLLVERGFDREPGSPNVGVGENRERNDRMDNGPVMALARIAAWSKSRFEFMYHPPRRGRFPHEPPILATGFPFGIWMSTRPITVADQLTSWPRYIHLRSLPPVQGDRLAVECFIDRPGHDGDVLAARPYVRGDSLRRVHWVHTARRDTLIVCERQSTSRGNVLVVLDREAFGTATSNDLDAWDWSLRVVASLCREFQRHAYDLTCELNGERFVVPPSATGLHRLFDRLAVFQPETRQKANEFEFATSGELNDLTILVTSTSRRNELNWLEQSGSGSRRSLDMREVVLDSAPAELCGTSDATIEPTMAASRPWICLTLANDPLGQLQQQWERRCHDNWANQLS